MQGRSRGVHGSGDHWTLLDEPHVQVLARLLTEGIDRAMSGQGGE
jgi:thioesterase domain-containing protein